MTLRSAERGPVHASLPLVAATALLGSVLWMKAGAVEGVPGVDAAAQGLQCAGEPCDGAARGRHAFSDRQLAGLDANGRSCADCHMPADTFQLSPANVEARYQRLIRQRREDPDADDPLFRPIDADDFRVNGEHASDYSNLRQNALIRITFPLPANIRLVDPQTGEVTSETFVDVWRSVPTVNDVALTGPDGGAPWMRGPNEFGGYQLDARFGTLQEQALGALVAHAQIRNPPPQQLLDDLAAFQERMFTNPRVRKLAAAVKEGALVLPDPDLPLEPLEEQGKAVFTRACGQCHGGPGQSTTLAPVVRFHDILSACPRPVDTAVPARFTLDPCPTELGRNARTYEITMPNGTKMRRTSSDPGRALLTGVVGGPAPLDDWNKLDTPGLRGIRHTAPYFHNNSAATLEEVVTHYVEFFKRVRANAAPGVIPAILTTDGVNIDRPPTPEEIAALLAYLKKL